VALDTDETLKLIDEIKIPPAPFVLQQLYQELQKDEPNLGLFVCL